MMVTIDDPPLIRRRNYIILITIILSLLLPRIAHEAFDNSLLSSPKIGWNSTNMEAVLLIISKEFAPKINNNSIGYGNGSCVPYARAKTGIQLTGWAGDLLKKADSAGYVISTKPVQGGMVITTEGGGHVAVVEEVKLDAIVISEQNYAGRYIVSSREIPIDDPKIEGYISVDGP